MATVVVAMVAELTGATRLSTALLVGWPALGVLLGTWAVVGPDSFEAVAAGPLRRRRWRRWARKQWPALAASCGLARSTGDGGSVVPRLVRARASGMTLTLRVRARAGQTVDDLHAAVPRLGTAAGAEGWSARPAGPGVLDVELVMGDLLRTTTHAPTPRDVVVDAVPVGRRQDGSTWRLPLRGRHTLVVGASGAGKGSVLWGICAGLAPAVSARLVRLWAVDLKGGLEVGVGAAMFSTVCTRDTDAVALLRRLLVVVEERQQAMYGVSRNFEPTPGDPVHVLVIDELAALTAYADNDTKTEASRLLSKILTQGRALGVVVAAFVQDPRKETVGMRNLFTQRVALRLLSADESRMVLGDGMGAVAPAHAIPPAQPGTAYVVDDDGTVDRVRAHYWTDDAVRAVAQLHPAPDLGDLPDPAENARTRPTEAAVTTEDAEHLAVVPDPAPARPAPARKPRAPRRPRAPRAPRAEEERAS